MNWRLKPKAKPKEIMESSFQTMIKKAIDDEGGTVSIYRYDPESPTGAFASKIAPFDSDVKDWKDRDVSAYLNQVHGGGRYRVQVNFKQKDGKLVEAKAYDYSIGGEPKENYYETKKAKQAETQQVTDIFKTAMEFAKDVKGGDGGNSVLIQSLILQNTELQKQNSLNMMEMQKLIIKSITDKDSGGNMSEMITNMMQMEEFKSMLQPKVEQNETLEMIRAVGPIVGALVAGKSQPQSQIQLAEALPPGQSDNNLGAHQLKTQATPSAKANEASHPTLPNGTEIKRDEFEIVMLDPLIDQINESASPEELAIMIKTIIDWSFWRVKSGVEPHPVVLGLVNALVQASQGKVDMTSIEKAYIDFTHAIEMPSELVEPIKNELLKFYAPFFQAKSGGVINAETTP